MMTTTHTTNSAAPASDPARRRRLMATAVAVVVVLFVVAFVVGRKAPSAPKPPPQTVGTQLDTALPADIAQLPLVDETGRSTNLASYKGKIVVLSDFMTLCQEICPITTSQLRQVDTAVTKAGLADKVQFVLITVDPQRDTPDQLHAYRGFAELPANFSLLTGTQDDLAKLWKYFGAGYQRVPEGDPPGTNWRTGRPLTYDVQHTDVLSYLDAGGAQRFVIVGTPNGTKAPLTAGEKAFLNDEGRDNLQANGAQNWTVEQATQVVSWLAKKNIRPID